MHNIFLYLRLTIETHSVNANALPLITFLFLQYDAMLQLTLLLKRRRLHV